MTLTTDQMKSWVEELIGKNRALEEEIKSLKSQRISADDDGNLDHCDQSFHTRFSDLEQVVKNIKSGQDAVLAKVSALEQENQTLKLQILGLMEGEVGGQDEIVRIIMGHMRPLEENKSLNSRLILAQGQGYPQEQGENFETRLCTLEQEVKEVKTKMIALELGNQTLKLNMLEVVLRKLEILEQKMSSGIETHGQEENPPPRMQMIIESAGVAPVNSDMKTRKMVTNPLEIEVIVRIIMGHVRPLDLLKCRQVSKLWRNAAQTDFQDKLTFHVKSNDDVKMFLTHSARSFPMFRNLDVHLQADDPQQNNLKEMVQLFATHGQSLHKLQLRTWMSHFESLYCWPLDAFRDVFLSSLHQIRELQINVVCQYFHEDRMFFPHHVRKVLHNLTTLNIELNGGECGFNHNSGDTQVSMDLLGLMPNLRTLYWRSVHRGIIGQDGSKNFIESLLLINPIKLENLFIYSAITDDLVRSIGNSNLNLKQLYLINFRGFAGVHFFSTPTVDGKKCLVTPKIGTYSEQHTGPALKTHLENELAKTKDMSCTKLLQVFLRLL